MADSVWARCPSHGAPLPSKTYRAQAPRFGRDMQQYSHQTCLACSLPPTPGGRCERLSALSPSSSPSCIVSIYGPGQVVAAASAVRSYEARNGDFARGEVAALVHPPLPRDDAEEATRVVSELVAPLGWQCHSMSISEALDGSRAAEGLRDRLPFLAPQHIFYAHDIAGTTPRLVMNAYPDAERVIYGDALGSVFLSPDPDEAHGTPSRTQTPADDERFLARLRRRWIMRPDRRSFELSALPPDSAELILPIDFSGGRLASIPMNVVPRDLVLDCVHKMRSAVRDLETYVSHALLRAPGYLLALSNISDCGITSLEDGVSLYESLVRRNVPPGGTVLVKPHPLGTRPLYDGLVERLSQDYSVELVPREFRFYPLELWGAMIDQVEVITGVSYSAVSLSFLFGKQTIHSLDDDLIEEYVMPEYRGPVRKSQAMHEEVLHRLGCWDGASVLWTDTP